MLLEHSECSFKLNFLSNQSLSFFIAILSRPQRMCTAHVCNHCGIPLPTSPLFPLLPFPSLFPRNFCKCIGIFIGRKCELALTQSCIGARREIFFHKFGVELSPAILFRIISSGLKLGRTKAVQGTSNLKLPWFRQRSRTIHPTKHMQSSL